MDGETGRRGTRIAGLETMSFQKEIKKLGVYPEERGVTCFMEFWKAELILQRKQVLALLKEQVSQ